MAAKGEAPEVRSFLADVEATEALGAALAHEVQRGDVIFLKGELGSGKTSLARGFMRRFFGNPALDVPSPSYLLHFVYSSCEVAPLQPGPPCVRLPAAAADAAKPEGPNRSFKASVRSLVPDCPVHHVDPYRLPAGRIAALLDFEDIFAAIGLIEWPDRLGEELVQPAHPPRLEVCFEGFGPQATGRSVSFSAVGERWGGILERWAREGGPLRSRPSDPVAPEEQDKEAKEEEEAQMQQQTSSRAQPAALRQCKPLPEDPKDWRVLGIESSCDDTGAAVLSGTGAILGEALASQAGIHEKWGGVVPRLAQEGHSKAIDSTVEEAMKRASVSPKELSAVAVTVGPGLSMCLEVGVRKAMQIAAAHRLPVVRVHHMEAHMLVTRLPQQAKPAGDAAAAAVTDEAAVENAAAAARGEEKQLEPAFPFLTLLVSGGHNMVVLSRGIGQHTILGSTIDDSIGEAFDKTARVLGITKVPGGPHLEILAKEGNPEAHKLPMPLSKTRDPVLQRGCDFSFSGLKTAVRTLSEKALRGAPVDSKQDASSEQVDEQRSTRADIAAAFQKVAVEHLCKRADRATDWALEQEPSTASLIVAGGVAANQAVRKGLTEVAEAAGLKMCCPPPRLCVDNGVMVAWAGIERLRQGLFEEPPSEAGAQHAVEVRPKWPLGVRDTRCMQPALSSKQASKGEKRKQRPAGEAGPTDGGAVAEKRPAIAG